MTDKWGTTAACSKHKIQARKTFKPHNIHLEQKIIYNRQNLMKEGENYQISVKKEF